MSPDEVELLLDSLKVRVRELERVVRDHGKRFDTLQTPLWKRIWFRLDGWPGQRDLNGVQAWRPWHKGGSMAKPQTGGTISLATPEPIHHGQQVTFDISTEETSQPWVTVVALVGGVVVYRQSNAQTDPGNNYAPMAQPFTLGPTPAWPSGPADAVATLENWDSYSRNRRITEIASTEFHIEA